MTGAQREEILADLALARRLERAEAVANASFVEARARVEPDLGARWIEVAQTYAMYDGPESPCTQTFGLGIFEMPTAADMDRLESFFQERGAPVVHEVSPLAGIGVMNLVHGRGYRPVEMSSVLYLPLRGWSGTPAGDGPLRARLARGDEQEVWGRTMAAGWGDVLRDPGLLLRLMRVQGARQDPLSFLAEWDGQPAAAAGLFIHGGVALLAGASTIPAYRHRGAQRALLAERLSYAARAGCDLGMVCAEPGSASQRNAERTGFRIAYTRIKWQLG